MQKTHVTAKTLGLWLGCSDRTIREHAERGVLTRDARGQYHLQDSVLAMAQHLRTVAAGRGGEKGTLDLTAERARHASAQADAQELKNAVTRGEMIHVEDVAAGWEDTMARVRTGVLAIPARVSHRHSISQEVLAALDREIRDALNELASAGDGDPESISGAATADETEAEPMG